MLYEWKLDGVTRNFGDALNEVLLPANIRKEWIDDPERMFFPIGSVICNEVIDETLRLGAKPVFVGCGWRGEDLDQSLVDQASFHGARGPHTQAELAKRGVEVQVTGDPAYEIPKLFLRGEPNALAICIRHINDPADYNKDSIFELKADALFSPVVDGYEDIVDMIKQISGARFVLAGSMHAAIVAHAYGVPFAPFSSGYINCPTKWYDLFASIGVSEPQWVSNVVEGREWYRDCVKK